MDVETGNRRANRRYHAHLWHALQAVKLHQCEVSSQLLFRDVPHRCSSPEPIAARCVRHPIKLVSLSARLQNQHNSSWHHKQSNNGTTQFIQYDVWPLVVVRLQQRRDLSVPSGSFSWTSSCLLVCCWQCSLGRLLSCTLRHARHV